MTTGFGRFSGVMVAVVLWFGIASPGAAAPGQQSAALPAPHPDRVVVLKSQRRLMLMRGDDVLRIYEIALGRYPKGNKQREGDARTPEGRYTLDRKRHDSAFYKAIHISYPNPQDVARARRLGVDPGGQIMIHGLPEDWTARELGHPWLDWTQGCIAVTNQEIDELFDLVRVGTPIEIHP